MGAAVFGGWIIAVGLISQAGGEAAIKEEQAKFQGTWRFDAIEINGKSVPLVDFDDARLVLKGKEFTMKQAGVSYGGTYAVDLSSKPKTIDVTFTDGPEAGKVSKGIYELEGDTYKVCMGLAGKDRPTSFATKKGGDCVLEVLKRSKR